MFDHAKPLRTCLISVFALATACGPLAVETRDASTEVPVELAPGSYKLSTDVSSSPNGLKAAAKRGEPFCANATSVDDWIHESLIDVLSNGRGAAMDCSSRDTARVGNLVTGVAVCPIASSGLGDALFTYSGVVSPGTVEVNGKMSWPTAQANLESKLDSMDAERRADIEKGLQMQRDMIVSAKLERVGDC